MDKRECLLSRDQLVTIGLRENIDEIKARFMNGGQTEEEWEALKKLAREQNGFRQ